MREDLAVDQLAADNNLRAVRRDEVHEVDHGRELLGKRVEAASRRRDEVDSTAAKPADELERFRRDVALRVEQLRRFEERQSNPAKQWKITDDDWRNREKYPQYKEAIEDMFRLTSTSFAPWIILESDDKRYARVKALRAIVAALEDAGLSD